MNKRQVALKYGFKSGFEMEFSEWLDSIGRNKGYEQWTIEWIQPEKKRKYTPDFHLDKKDGTRMYLETKGRWVTDDRMKHRYLANMKDKLDIRMVFENPKAKIKKGSKTTYAMYCEKYGIKYSPFKKAIPEEWLAE